MQMSMSEDGLRADIDVDYRSSRSPQSLFNGHLTASNSDVRAGDNPRLHNARWSGLVLWWQDTFGKLQVDAAPSRWTSPTPTAPWARRPPSSRPAVGRLARQARGRRAGVPHRLAGPAPVRSGARVPLAAGLCLPEPERRWEEPGARRGRRAPRGSQADGIRGRAPWPSPGSDERHRRLHAAQSRPPGHGPPVQEGIPAGAGARRPRRRQYLCNQAAAPAAGTPHRLLRRHLHVSSRRRRNAGDALEPRRRALEDRVVSAARALAGSRFALRVAMAWMLAGTPLMAAGQQPGAPPTDAPPTALRPSSLPTRNRRPDRRRGSWRRWFHPARSSERPSAPWGRTCTSSTPTARCRCSASPTSTPRRTPPSRQRLPAPRFTPTTTGSSALGVFGYIKNDYDDYLGTGQPLKTNDDLKAVAGPISLSGGGELVHRRTGQRGELSGAWRIRARTISCSRRWASAGFKSAALGAVGDARLARQPGHADGRLVSEREQPRLPRGAWRIVDVRRLSRRHCEPSGRTAGATCWRSGSTTGSRTTRRQPRRRPSCCAATSSVSISRRTCRRSKPRSACPSAAMGRDAVRRRGRPVR